jgi:thymidylate synthase
MLRTLRTPRLRFVLSSDVHHRIGIGGELLYSIPLDMQRFLSLTADSVADIVGDPVVQNGLIMGYHTWRSLPRKPLRRRISMVLTRTHADEVRRAGGYAFASPDELMHFVQPEDHVGDNPGGNGGGDATCPAVQVGLLYVIGGAEIFKLFATHPVYADWIERIHWTYITKEPKPGDSPTEDSTEEDSIPFCTFSVPAAFPQFTMLEEWSTVTEGTALYPFSQQGIPTAFRVSFRTLGAPMCHTIAQSIAVEENRSGEEQYLALLRTVMCGPRRHTRNAETHSVFGGRIVVDLSDGRVPLLTTKRMAWKTILKELLWFVRGQTDNALLQQQNVHIWDANASRAFLDTRGLTHRDENDLGPVYGFQWRHSGAAYTDCHADYTGQGYDQLEANRLVLQDDPHSRRMLFTAWNPRDLDEMALPPCHVLGQWYVDDAQRVWLQLYQRSGDMFLGVPFNLFSYAALVHMMAHLTNRRPGGLLHILGDMHVYTAHLDVIQKQLSRCPRQAPQLRFCRKALASAPVKAWEDFQLNHFELHEYAPDGVLRTTMVA